MVSLRDLACLDVLRRKVIEQRTPFLGICIGLQVLFDHSEEEDTPCLGWLPGRVRRYRPRDLPVPQIGWNEVRFRPHPITRALPPTGHFYFVNGYHAVPTDPSLVVGTADYGGDFCAMVARENIVAAQFHVEKSGPLGLRLLQTFATLEQEAWCSLAV
jgi:glutamine amidotransferase